MVMVSMVTKKFLWKQGIPIIKDLFSKANVFMGTDLLSKSIQ